MPEPTAGHEAMIEPPDRFITLLRHGEVAGGARFRGRRDDPLTETGWRKVIDAAERALALQPATSRIITSPARRCAEPAERLARDHGLRIERSDALAERAFGDWEGLPGDQIPAPQLQRFWADPAGYTPPGAEPFHLFRTRVIAGWWRRAVAPLGDALIVTHGGVIRVIVADLLSLADPTGLLIEVPHACLTRIRIPSPPGRPSVVSHGPVHCPEVRA